MSEFFFTLIFELGRQHLKGTTFLGVITFVFTAPGSSLSLSQLAIFDQINADVLLKSVSFPYLATFICPVVFLYPVSTRMAVGFKNVVRSTRVNTWSNFKTQTFVEVWRNLCQW